MDFKNNSKQIIHKKKIKVNDKLKGIDDQTQIEIEKEKTKQLELIREIKKLELKLSNKKKYKHTKKYLDLSSILDDSDNEMSDNSINNYEEYDTISIQSTHSITTIEYQ